MPSPAAVARIEAPVSGGRCSNVRQEPRDMADTSMPDEPSGLGRRTFAGIRPASLQACPPHPGQSIVGDFIPSNNTNPMTIAETRAGLGMIKPHDHGSAVQVLVGELRWRGG